MSRVISISAKCSDLFSMSMDGKEYNGYVPKWISPDGYGDYVEFEIDLDTGKILNWKVPSKEEVDRSFSGGEEESYSKARKLANLVEER